MGRRHVCEEWAMRSKGWSELKLPRRVAGGPGLSATAGSPPVPTSQMNGHCLLASTPAGASQAGSQASTVPTAEVPSQPPQSFLPSAAPGLVGPSLLLESPFPVMTSVMYIFAQSLPLLLSYDFP